MLNSITRNNLSFSMARKITLKDDATDKEKRALNAVAQGLSDNTSVDSSVTDAGRGFFYEIITPENRVVRENLIEKNIKKDLGDSVTIEEWVGPKEYEESQVRNQKLYDKYSEI